LPDFDALKLFTKKYSCII